MPIYATSVSMSVLDFKVEAHQGSLHRLTH